MTNTMETTPAVPTKVPKKDKKEIEEDLSFEERRLKNDCDRLVTRIISGTINVEEELQSIHQSNLSLHDETDPHALASASSDEIRKHALIYLLNALRSATSSLSAIPKSIKFLRNHFTTLQLFYEDAFKLRDQECRKLLASILSVVATSIASDNNLILHYYLESPREPLSDWGFEYLRALSREIAKEYLQILIAREEEERDEMAEESDESEEIDHQAELDQLIVIAKEIIQVYFKNSNDFEAVDLALEVQITPYISQFIHHSSAYRICSYLVSCAQYIPDITERDNVLKTAYDGFLANNYFVPALQVAIDFYTSSPTRRETGQEYILNICSAVQQASLSSTTSTSTQEITSITTMEDEEFSTPAVDTTLTGPTRVNPNFVGTKKRVIVKPEDVNGIYRQLGYILGASKVLFPQLEEYDLVYQAATNAEQSSLFRKALDEFGANKPKAVFNVIDQPTSRNRTGRDGAVENSLQNFTSALANGLINCGTGQELLFSHNDETGESLKSTNPTPSNTNFIYRLKPEHRYPAVASLGLVHLWDVEEGFSALDAYEASTDTQVQAGVALGYGVLSSGINSELNASVALLSDKLDAGQPAEIRTAAALGLGLARTGTSDEEVVELLLPILINDELPIETIAHAALGLGLTCLGTCHPEVSQLLFQTLVTMNAIITSEEEEDQEEPATENTTDSNKNDKNDNFTLNVNNAIKTSIASHNQSALRLIALSLALVYAGTGNAANQILSDIQENFEMHPLNTYFIMTVTTFAFITSSSVEKIQALMITCSASLYEEEGEKTDKKETSTSDKKSKKSTTPESIFIKLPGIDDDNENAEKNVNNPQIYTKYIHQDAALLGLAGLACGDQVTIQMLHRLLGHLIQTSDLNIKRTIPFALALLYTSDPNITITGQVFKMAHDQDEIVSRNACLALGFMGFGTGNSKLNENISYLLKYFVSDKNHNFYAQVAQSMLYAGHNLLSLAPKPTFFAQTNKMTCALLLAFFHIANDPCDNLLSKRQHLWLLLAPMIKSRIITTVNDEGNLISVPTRIGQGVDIVGQPGNPRPLTGFQTQPSPVVLNINQAAELGTDDYLLYATETPTIGVVVVKPAPPKV